MKVKGYLFVALFLLLLWSTALFAECCIDTAYLSRFLLNEGYPSVLRQADQECVDTTNDFMNAMYLLDSGQPQQAIFAFDRVLLIEPRHFHAMYHLARAYFRLCALDKAKVKFIELLNSYPPEEFVVAAEPYLCNIESRAPVVPIDFQFYLNGITGYNDNVNAAPDDPFLSIPIVGPIQLDGQLLGQGDGFAETLATFRVTRRCAKDRGMYAQLSYNHRQNYSLHDFDWNIYGGQLAFFNRINDFYIRTPLKYEVFTTGTEDNTFRQFASFGIEVQKRTSYSTYLGLTFEVQELRFPASSLRNGLNYVVLGNWTINSTGKGVVIDNKVYYALVQPEHRELGNPLVRDFFGAQIFASWNVWGKFKPYLAVNAQVSAYKANDIAFLTTRNDRYYNLALGWIWQINNNWALEPDYIVSYNYSNMDSLQYKQNMIQVQLQYQFTS